MPKQFEHPVAFAVDVIVTHFRGPRIAFLERVDDGTLAFFGGEKEPGDPSVADAAVRELREEGFDSDERYPFGSSSRLNFVLFGDALDRDPRGGPEQPFTQVIAAVHHIQLTDHEADAMKPGREGKAIKWLPVSEAIALATEAPERFRFDHASLLLRAHDLRVFGE